MCWVSVFDCTLNKKKLLFVKFLFRVIFNNDFFYFVSISNIIYEKTIGL